MRPSTADTPAALPTLRAVAGAALIVATLLLGVWLWSRFCRFPSIAWNDMRLAPTLALAQGFSVYPTGGHGTIGTWMYGPLPLLFFWPASWAPTAADALMVAAAMNIALTLVPLALVCFLWPAGDARGDSRSGRAAAFLLCLALWPEANYSVHFSDNLAIACGLIANLILVRASHPRDLWVAAALATSAIACKQICLGMPLAQVLWLGITVGRGAAGRHALRCALTGLALAAALIAFFGWEGLWFTLVKVPAGLGWARDPIDRLRQVAPVLALQLGGPVAVMLFARRAFAQPALLLPALAWLCAIPLGLAGLMKLGGWTNSVHSWVLWLPAVLTHALTSHLPARRTWVSYLAAGVVAAGLASARILQEPALALRPQITAYREAENLTARFPGALWFPLHPLVTLFADHRYYHDEDGLYVRINAHRPPTPAQTAAHLPPLMRMMVFRNNWTDWGIARQMLPPDWSSATFGNWIVWNSSAVVRPPP